MIVPNYWAAARIRHRVPGRQMTVRRFGWSDVSQEAAADGVPIREEVIARHGETVITRNRYGAPCLNTRTSDFASTTRRSRSASFCVEARGI